MWGLLIMEAIITNPLVIAGVLVALFLAAQRLTDSAEIISRFPTALQLRYLQTLTEVATENNSTTLFPIPIDLLEPFLQMRSAEEGAPDAVRPAGRHRAAGAAPAEGE